ncbi:hypothetical protein HFP89_15295 [Wenzhouxiangella sp. XN79A]|uniref:SAM-dependent methyltransferase n=1 Tax=Wenzhouxiangella sp. XN79A TaxID=2724193 RepID=UPI00144ABACA|nr:hypothetical protein [Wenzhouxiangella sp. XN79A]
MSVRPGRLSVVGTGIRLAGQLTVETRHLVRHADRVFAVMADPFSLDVLRELNPEVVSLQVHYARGRSRDESYRRMVTAILEPVRAGAQVCAAFYGHPGVFVWPAHEAVRQARSEGFEATMYPGISAEDCLVADLGIDPGVSGLQTYEAADFLVHPRRFDPRTPLVLWQLAVLGDRSRSTFRTDPTWVRALADLLAESYSDAHAVIVYEAAVGPFDATRIDRVPLNRLHELDLTQASTLYVPPIGAPEPDPARLRRLGLDPTGLAEASFQKYRRRG